MFVVATAGHVDHGKSALVRALTGIDPDRWAEEKERGLTIDLGFAHTVLASGPVAFVDVPGHERFLRNMLAGVGAVDAVLLVVSAVEGWKAQSEEHLAIVELLGIDHGLVALTHADRVDDRRRAEVEEQVRDRLARGALAQAEVVATAAPTGVGVDRLAAALDRLAGTVPAATDRGRPRLWIDRSFSIRGSGTVVTGTLVGGPLAVGRTLVTAPGEARSRIRTIQVHGEARDQVGPGHRVALNLPGLGPADGRRGVALVEPGRWHPTTVVDATLAVLATASHPVTHRGAHLLHTGTGAWAVRVQVLHRRSIGPGATGLVRIRLPEALPLRPGDRYVLRDTGSDTTVGGGTVLDLDPVTAPNAAHPDQRWERVVEEHGWIETDHLERLTGVSTEPTVGRWVVSDAALAGAVDGLASDLEAAGSAGLRRSALGDRARALALSGLVPDVVVDAEHVTLARHGDALDRHPWLVRLRAEPFRPPAPDGVPADEVDALVRRRLVFVRGGIHFPDDAIAAATAVLAALPATDPGGFTLSEARRALDTTRPYAMALLEEMDSRGRSRRRGDRRTLTPSP